jgi:hypothetical protein
LQRSIPFQESTYNPVPINVRTRSSAEDGARYASYSLNTVYSISFLAVAPERGHNQVDHSLCLISMTGAEMPSIRGLNTVRARSYIFRLPLFTRVIIFVIFSFWAASVQSVWDLRKWGALIPSEVNFGTGIF